MKGARQSAVTIKPGVSLHVTNYHPCPCPYPCNNSPLYEPSS